MSTGEGLRRLLRVLAYGPARRPLEPHRPLPWLLRGLGWSLVALGLGTALTGLVAFVAGNQSFARVAVPLAGTAVPVGLGVRWVAEMFRPEPLELSPSDET